MTDNTTRRKFMGALTASIASGVLADTALGQQLTLQNQPKGKQARSTKSLTKGKAAFVPPETENKDSVSPEKPKTGGQRDRKNPVAELEEFPYLTPELQAFLLENADLTTDAFKKRGRLYMGFYPDMDADYRIMVTGSAIFMVPRNFSEKNLFGQPSGFDYTVPEDFGFNADARLMSRLSSDAERRKIELTIGIFNRNLHIVTHYPFCTSEDDISRGDKMSGKCSRDPLFVENENIDKVLQANGIIVSPEERALYGLFTYPTTTEEAGRAGIFTHFPSLCNGYLGITPFGGGVLCRGLAEYPSRGTPGLNKMYDDLKEASQTSRSQCLKKALDILRETLSGRHPSFGKISPIGMEILRSLSRHCSSAENRLDRLDLESLKPKGIFE